MHGLGYSNGRKIDGRFTAICLEDLTRKTPIYVSFLVTFLDNLLLMEILSTAY
jgi:hypothetical protein